MVVNKDGDLELYAIHDASKQLAWSARGDLAVGAGLGLKVLEGYRDLGYNDDSASDAIHPPRATHGLNNTYGNGSNRDGVSRSRSGPSRSASASRGSRGRPNPKDDESSASATPQVPIFGRGDEDGFPALSSGTATAAPTGLSSSRPGKTRTYSPASVRKYRSGERGEPSSLRRRSPSRTDTLPANDDKSKPANGPQRPSGRHGSRARSKDVKKAGVVHIVQEDISMIMRRRAKAGYGLSQVPTSKFFSLKTLLIRYLGPICSLSITLMLPKLIMNQPMELLRPYPSYGRGYIVSPSLGQSRKC